MSRGRFVIRGPLLLCLLWLVAAAAAVPAQAARVVLLGRHGHASVRNDQFLTTPADTPVPQISAPVAPRARAAGGVSVHTQLKRLWRTRAISTAAYHRYLSQLGAAEAAAAHLGGTRSAEMGDVLANLHDIAASGLLTASRLPVLFTTIDRNRAYWSQGPLLGYGQRVEFAGSQIVWEYYPGQGIELQVLGSFGKANGLYTAGRAHHAQMLSLLRELIPLAAARGGGLAWEYYFHFDGGIPPWTSAMSQGTALVALSRAYRITHDPSYLALAHRALPVLGDAPPVGVSVRTHLGRRFLLYSFAPGAAVINGFLQTLIGLFDYAHVSGDRTAARLFAAGDAEARAEVPHYDTGAWSLYEPGQEDTLGYHTLVTGFLHGLCSRVHAKVYCATAAHFDAYLKTPPALTLLTTRLRAHHAGIVSFRLSKISHVGIVITRNGRTLFATSADFPYGVHAFAVPSFAQTGSYEVRLAATDLAGNFNRIVVPLTVAR